MFKKLKSIKYLKRKLKSKNTKEQSNRSPKKNPVKLITRKGMPIIHPLTMNMIHSMVEIEELLYNKKFSKELLGQLLNIYSVCVEYYDSIHDPISTYFMEKIQIALSNSKSLNFLITDENTTKNTDSKPTNDQKPKEKSKPIYKRKISFDTKMKVRSKKANLDIKVIELSNSLKVPEIVNKHFKNNEDIDDIIQGNLEDQEDGIKTRLTERRQNSLLKSFNRSNNSFTVFRNKEEINYSLSVNTSNSQFNKSNLSTGDKNKLKPHKLSSFDEGKLDQRLKHVRSDNRIHQDDLKPNGENKQVITESLSQNEDSSPISRKGNSLKSDKNDTKSSSRNKNDYKVLTIPPINYV